MKKQNDETGIAFIDECRAIARACRATRDTAGAVGLLRAVLQSANGPVPIGECRIVAVLCRAAEDDESSATLFTALLRPAPSYH